MDPVHLFGYQLVLTRVAEECGGARTAYYYDLLMPQNWRKNLRMELHLCMVMPKAKVESSVKVAERLSGRGAHGLQSSSPATKGNKAAEYQALGDPLRLFGHQFGGAGVVPVHARRDGPTRTADKRKMARVRFQVKQRVEFRPSVPLGTSTHIEIRGIGGTFSVSFNGVVQCTTD